MKKKFYLVREKDGSLFIWSGCKPIKNRYFGWWGSSGSVKYDSMELPKTMFPFVKWEDKKPLEVKLISNIKFYILLDYSDRQMVLKDYNIQHHDKQRNSNKKTKTR